MRIAVLASGGGSNLQALIDSAAGDYEIVLVASDRTDSGALNRASAAGIPSEPIPDPKNGTALAGQLLKHDPGLIVLAGYMKLLPLEVVERFENRIINIHPALLPSFGGKGMYGIRVHEAVLEARAGLSGVTVHMVNAEFDRGRILAQWPVPVLPDDDAQNLAARVLAVEHQILPEVVRRAAKNGSPIPLRPSGKCFVAETVQRLDFTTY